MRLTALGWDEGFAAAFDARAPGADVEPARVAIEFNYLYRVWTADGEVVSTVSGRLKHRVTSRSELPAVGDWVALRKRAGHATGTIVAVLPRRSAFSRRMAGAVTEAQVAAANVDVVFIVMGLDRDFSLRRLERYLLLAHESGAAPVVLLTKPDLSGQVGTQVEAVEAIAGSVPIHVVNPKANTGLDLVAASLTSGRTGALLGSSGVGKSTIINRLVGEDIQKTREVRKSDSRGRHTTTHRELVALPGGGLIIDTPGMRELQLWDVDEAVRETFGDIDALAATCHFTNCRHRDEPRCAVKAAVAEGRLPADRLESYLGLQGELAAHERQRDERATIEHKRRSKIAGKAVRKHLKTKRL
ncbi:MAG: ribosome small subunit-dependent GTPase A [Acidobacteria bacterium]|nr:ribosome small subunit-dependent GTPase A [Acidobacteriota bacterium]